MELISGLGLRDEDFSSKLCLTAQIADFQPGEDVLPGDLLLWQKLGNMYTWAQRQGLPLVFNDEITISPSDTSEMLKMPCIINKSIQRESFFPL